MPTIYHSREYLLNEDFFSTWSPTMAYVLGFWFADGYMRHEKSYRIYFTSNDLQHLSLIKNVLKCTSPIICPRRHGVLDKTGFLSIHSKKLYYQLQQLGGERKKSIKLKFPYVPKIFLPDYIRGYFDGDGSVYFVRYKHSKNKRIYTNIRSNFTSGSNEFLAAIRNILSKELNLYFKKICQFGPHQFKLGYGQSDTNKLLHYMYYPNHPISLQRKEIYLKRF